jgi:hypothetical protein
MQSLFTGWADEKYIPLAGQAKKEKIDEVSRQEIGPKSRGFTITERGLGPDAEDMQRAAQ